MHEYTPGMIRKFYRACVIKSNEDFIDHATASRFSQATEQSWRSVTQNIQRSIKTLMGQATGKKAQGPQRRGDADLSSFFGLVTRNPKTGRLTEKTRGDLDANT